MDTRCATSSQVVCMKRTRCTTSSQVDFMKRRKYTTTSQVVLEDDDLLTSSQVVLKDDDLLTLILLRVPYGEVVSSLKSVSKQWRSLITTPHFTRRLRNSIHPLRACGLFIQRPFVNEVFFFSLDNPNTPSQLRTVTFADDPSDFDPEKIRIQLSCNGLFLCCYVYARRPKKLRKYYVYNPSTNHLETFPEHPPGSGNWVHYVGLAFDPSKSIHYKVIAFDIVSGNFYIFSSESGTWKASVESFSPPPGLDIITGGVYWNGCIHWLSKPKSESELESTVSDCFRFNVDDERLETFPRPPTGVRSASRRSLYFGESEGHLHFVEDCPDATSLDVYEMKSDYSGWFLKYQIDLDPISKVFPEMTKQYKFSYKNDYAFFVRSLIRRENFREDPFLVLEIPGKVIRYNLVTGSVKIVWEYFSVDPSRKIMDACTFGHLRVWQFIVSV